LFRNRAAARFFSTLNTMSLLSQMIPQSLYSAAGAGASVAATTSFPVQERPAASQPTRSSPSFMIPAPAEKKKIEMYSPVSLPP